MSDNAHREAATYIENVKTYDSGADEAHVQKIVNHLGVVLMNNDAKLVSCSDLSERERIRDGFAFKKLGMSADAAEKAIEEVCQSMGEERNKSRVTFYYMLAKNAGMLDKL